MKINWFLMACFSLAATSLAGDHTPGSRPGILIDPSQPLEGWTSSCIVVNVVDGDTVDVEVRRVLRVRLIDCWAPESRTKDKAEKKKGLAAKAHLKSIAEDKPGVLFIPGSRRQRLSDILTLNRLAGYVFVEGESIGQLQRQAGHASAEKK